MLFGFIGFFIQENIIFKEDDLSFHIYIEETDKNGNISKNEIGVINADNFDVFRNEILKILGLKQIETKKPKYKTERARKLAEKIAKAKAQLTKTSQQDGNMSFDNLIKKYCTHNKVGINILNVWDMTYYQFIQAVESKMKEVVKEDTTLSIYTAEKNNGVKRQGITIAQKGINISPTIYLEEYYEKYKGVKPNKLTNGCENNTTPPPATKANTAANNTK